MKRRDLIKSILCAAPIAAVGLSGCDNMSLDVSNRENSEEFEIIPKQTAPYKFSLPLTFNHAFIDTLAEYNKKYKKSQIDVLYNNIPWPASSKYNEWFQTKRGENDKIKNFNDFMVYAKHAMNNGFQICYLINSPKPFNDKDIKPFINDIYKLLDDIYNAGIRHIKVASTQVAEIISEYNNEFELTASVLFEYHNIGQYMKFMEFNPRVKRIVITKDENQNFKFLKNIRKLYPDITLEMMLDEGCIKNCPSRFFCMSGSETTKIGNHLGCTYLKEYPYIGFYENGIIRPWDLNYYSAIGINNFKLVQTLNRAVDKDNKKILIYMDYVEHGFKSKYIDKYIRNNTPLPEEVCNSLDTKTLLSYYPDIKFFIKNGHKCGDSCGVECNYCKQRAKELQKLVYDYNNQAIR